MHRMWLALASLALVAGCGANETGRLTATMLTGTCSWNGQEYLGVADFRLSLEYTPSNLAERELPRPGTCDNDSFLFPEESNLQGGADIPKLDGSPAWAAKRDSGSLANTEPGLWFQDVYRHQPAGCGQVDEVAGEGVNLVDAGVFSGATTPAPSAIGLVKIDGLRDDQWKGEVGYGRKMDVSWDGAEWDETFVQVRQWNGKHLRDVVTCNTTGTSSKNLDAAFWGTVSDIGAEKVEVYVGFQNRGVDKASGGDALQTITRVVHVMASPEDTGE